MIDWNGDGKVDFGEAYFTAKMLENNTGRGGRKSRGCGCCLLPCLTILFVLIGAGCTVFTRCGAARKE